VIEAFQHDQFRVPDSACQILPLGQRMHSIPATMHDQSWRAHLLQQIGNGVGVARLSCAQCIFYQTGILQHFTKMSNLVSRSSREIDRNIGLYEGAAGYIPAFADHAFDGFRQAARGGILGHIAERKPRYDAPI